MNIIVDVDGVVADLHSVWLARYNHDWNDCLRIEEITEWELYKFVKCGKLIYSYLELPDLYDTVEPIPGALKGVEFLRTMGFRVVFVTTGNRDQKFNWLQKHKFLPPTEWKDHPDYVCCKDKSLVRARIIIDDNVDTLIAHPAWHILYDQPWNRHATAIARAHNWQDVIAKVRYLWAATAEM